jgi:FAD dependent oxidoreductase TIGR03364
VGAGIVGLGHALAAARLGKRVVVIDREAQANGASIRNFGFVTVTGQERGATWRRARRSRDVWDEVARAAGIPIQHRGLAMVARRPEARAVLERSSRPKWRKAAGCSARRKAGERLPMLAADRLAGVLWSKIDLRVESREAIPRLAAWLQERHRVTFLRNTLVRSVTPPAIETTSGRVEAGACVVCPGDDFLSLFPERIAAYGLTKCKLHMMRLAPPGWRLPAAVMSDLGLVRYLGYAALPEAVALRTRLEAEQNEALAHGVHLIVVQSADGSLVVGDSHHYGATPDPFAPQGVDEIILDEYRAVFRTPPPVAVERWTGIYASAPDRTMFVDAPSERVRIAMVTSGTGASTGFAIGEEVVADLFGSSPSGAA